MRFLVVFLFFIAELFALTLPKQFSADFNQTIDSDQKTLHYRGEIFYKNGQIVWKYTYPYQKTIWVKSRIYIYEPDLMQVTVIDKKENNLIEILKKAKKIDKNRYETEYKGKKYYFILSNGKIKLPQKIYYTDEMGNKVVIKFYNFKNEVNDKVFDLNFPDDVDVIHQR